MVSHRGVQELQHRRSHGSRPTGAQLGARRRVHDPLHPPAQPPPRRAHPRPHRGARPSAASGPGHATALPVAVGRPHEGVAVRLRHRRHALAIPAGGGNQRLQSVPVPPHPLAPLPSDPPALRRRSRHDQLGIPGRIGRGLAVQHIRPIDAVGHAIGDRAGLGHRALGRISATNRARIEPRPSGWRSWAAGSSAWRG